METPPQRICDAPVCIVLPVLLVVLSWLLGISEISWREFLPYFPFTKLAVSIVLELAAIAGGYWMSSRQIRRDVMIDAIRDDTV